MDTLTKHQHRRYSRNILLPEIGKEGQIKLLGASVLIIGAGALGTVVAMYLAASGVGHIGICDFDTIDISNLQRQLSFTENDLGKKKVEILADKLREINSEIRIDTYPELLRKDKANTIFADYDVIVEGSDNPNTKYMVTDIAKNLSKPCIFGGVAQFAGQVMTILPGGTTYRDLFPEAAGDGEFMPCSVGGVLGPVPGIVGSIQATEVIKVITLAGTPLAGQLLTFDALTMSFRKIKI